MEIKLSDLAPFQEICKRICLNIPSVYIWQWDDKRDMAVMVLEEEDAEMVFYPLFKEFNQHWNFTSAPSDSSGITRWVDANFGLMPGQVMFTSYPLCNLVLCVAWWPWGGDRKVSMRIGLIPVNKAKLRKGTARQCLGRWLIIQEDEAP
ncbi:MAG: hypothetical protein HKP58_08890 [Desulfatitalea sp.]|nr:hypothetical protein [Desulfatitalea sp.]NNK00515.1 hypothetical protein [Desulfatitalea sp.]